MVAERGEYKINFTAENGKGSVSRELKLVVGDKISLTPPMGWNSWNCFNFAVTEKNIRDAADAMVSSGLADHGWTYVNIDDFWQNNPYRFKDDPTLQGAERKPDGTINPNARFPDMKGLADYVHAKGLMMSSMRGRMWCPLATLRERTILVTPRGASMWKSTGLKSAMRTAVRRGANSSSLGLPQTFPLEVTPS